MIKIGQASLDENNRTTGGKAGNQNDRELNIKPYYLHKKGWRVFRAVNEYSRDKIATAMILAVNNKKIGYDQRQRDTLWNNSKLYGYDPSKVTVACETDCSALVRVCCAYANIVLQNFNTSNEPRVLLGSQQFVEVTNFNPENGNGLQTGDILVTRTKGHTVVVVSGDERDPSKKYENYYAKYAGSSSSIVEALESVGEMNTSFNNRLAIAKANNIVNYSGRAEQNMKMLELLKEGKLRKA